MRRALGNCFIHTIGVTGGYFGWLRNPLAGGGVKGCAFWLARLTTPLPRSSAAWSPPPPPSISPHPHSTHLIPVCYTNQAALETARAGPPSSSWHNCSLELTLSHQQDHAPRKLCSHASKTDLEVGRNYSNHQCRLRTKMVLKNSTWKIPYCVRYICQHRSVVKSVV